tara:strand:+ start:5394 stop:10586 length:5193 start_codon:yes stop_codon:yes gene_type:complete
MGYLTAEEVMKGSFGRLPRALILVIIPAEARAVYVHLKDRETIIGPKGILYEVGRFADPAGDWAVVVANPSPGNVEAGTSAQKAHSDFGGSFQAQLVVGVAGSLKLDIEIGSVVVAELAYNAHSGKEADAGFQSRPHSGDSSPVLLSAGKKAVVDGDWVDLIQSPLRYTLPAPAQYPPPCAYPPEGYVKPVASAEVVLSTANGALYKRIREGLSDAAAVEMEGWGAMKAAQLENTPAIIVRGISDRCNGKDPIEDAAFQPIAAAHAAAMAMKILSIRSMAGERGADQPSNLPDVAPGPAVGTEPPPSGGPKTSIVVNFDGLPADFDATKLEELKAVLINLTGDTTLTIGDVRPGSARVIVEINEKAAEKLSSGSLTTALHGDLKARFRGVGRLDQLDAAVTARDQFKSASRELLAWDRTLPDGTWLERPELGELLALVKPGDGSVTVLLGEPGSGKTALLSAFTAQLEGDDVPVLAIKADLLSTTVQSEEDLKVDLGLDVLPGDAIMASAVLGPTVLAIDQLDALASQIDLKTGRLNAVLNLVRRVGGAPNVHVVLSARTFEYNHDARLKSLPAEALQLQLPPWSSVADVLSQRGVNAEQWPEDARDIIRAPQALKTYLKIRDADGNVDAYPTYQAMLEGLWQTWRLMDPDSDELLAFASSIAFTMAEEEALWLATSRFDRETAKIVALERFDILVRSENGLGVGFSHQTVFDYVLARTFVGMRDGLTTYIVQRQESLFIRPKLWSALTYLRGAEVASYERELVSLWSARLRPHLKMLLVEFIGSQASPLDKEVTFFVEALHEPSSHMVAINAMIGSRGWFDQLQGFITGLMVGSREDAWNAYRLLVPIWEASQDVVLKLIDDHWAPVAGHDDQLWSLLGISKSWSAEHDRLAKLVLSRTDVSPLLVNDLVMSVAAEDAQAAARIALIALEKELARAEAWRGKPKPPEDTPYPEYAAWHAEYAPTIPYEKLLKSGDWHSVPDLATHSPSVFLRTLWPFYERLFHDLATHYGDRPDRYADSHAVAFDFDDGGPDIILGEGDIVGALRIAVEAVAADDVPGFLEWAREKSVIAFAPVQSLIANTLRLIGADAASFSHAWLLADRRRFELGDSQRPRRSSSALVSAVSPYWTSEELREFEDALHAYEPDLPAWAAHDVNKRRAFKKHFRKLRRHLMSLLPTERTSPRTRTLLETEQRALSGELDPGVQYSGVQTIGSPMSTEAMLKAKPQHVLKAFQEVPDDTDWDHPTKWMKGGNVQLSRAFSEFAKQRPERALDLMKSFRPTEQERAAGYALDAMAGAGVDRVKLETMILELDAKGFRSDEYMGSVAHAIQRLSDKEAPLSEPILAMLERWLAMVGTDNGIIHDSRDDEQIGEGKTASAKEPRGSVLWGYGGISFLPHGAYPILAALTKALLHQGFEGRDRLVIILTNHLVRNKDRKTWQAIFRSLAHAGGNRPEPVSTFLRTVFDEIPDLVETTDAILLLAHAQRWDNEFVRDITAGWRTSKSAKLRQSYGELIALMALTNSEAHWASDALAEALAAHDPIVRIGIAYAGANLFSESAHCAKASELLVGVAADATDEEILAAMDVFRMAGEFRPDRPTLNLMCAFAATPADISRDRGTFIVEAMQGLLPHAADPIGAIALRLADGWKAELTDMASGMAMLAPELTDVALTLHRLGGPSRRVGMDVFERLVEVNAYGARETLIEIDRRFERPLSHLRRRIPRRARSPRRRR